MDSPQRALQINGIFFSNFKFITDLMAENREIFKRIASREN